MADQPTSEKNKALPPGLVVGLAVVGVLWLAMVPAFLSSLLGGGGGDSATTPKSKEREAIDFCKMVRETVKPGDKVCGKYLAAVDAELAKEKQDAAAAEAQRQAEAEEAANPNREISSLEMTTCRMALKEAMKDPSSFKVNNSTRRGGGLIDYTATNGFGGPVRNTFQCTTGQNIGGG